MVILSKFFVLFVMSLSSAVASVESGVEGWTVHYVCQSVAGSSLKLKVDLYSEFDAKGEWKGSRVDIHQTTGSFSIEKLTEVTLSSHPEVPVGFRKTTWKARGFEMFMFVSETDPRRNFNATLKSIRISKGQSQTLSCWF